MSTMLAGCVIHWHAYFFHALLHPWYIFVAFEIHPPAKRSASPHLFVVSYPCSYSAHLCPVVTNIWYQLCIFPKSCYCYSFPSVSICVLWCPLHVVPIGVHDFSSCLLRYRIGSIFVRFSPLTCWPWFILMLKHASLFPFTPKRLHVPVSQLLVTLGPLVARLSLPKVLLRSLDDGVN